MKATLKSVAFLFMSIKTETLVVGQGMAGTCIALALKQQNRDFLVVDNQHHLSSSIVAAGLYNPIVFYKQTLSFNAEKLIPFTKAYYAEWERAHGVEVHKERVFTRVFSSVEEQNDWLSKSSRVPHSMYMKSGLVRPNPQLFNAPFQASHVQSAGGLDVPVFLSKSRDYFIAESSILNDRLKKVEPQDEHWKCILEEGKTILAQRIIFCEGHQSMNNPYFNYLPITGTKGDVLTIKCPEMICDDVVNAGFFIMPLGNDYYRVGASFEWNNHSHEISIAARHELEGKLKGLLKVPFEVIDQLTGMRPTTGDRRPVMGAHPKFEGLYIFNGLGSKGVLLAPYYANHLTDHIFNNIPIEKEVSIHRYLKHYGNTKN